MIVEEIAHAKINLALHITGQRPDGYHTLDSIVVFTELGDRLQVRPATQSTFALSGPMAAAVPTDASNLVLRAAKLMGASDIAITLHKELPVAAGIGGGSADAAATLRAVLRLTGLPIPEPHALAELGADVPVCLEPRPQRMRGLGEILTELPELPAFWLVLVNPGVALSTQRVFAALKSKNGKALPDELPKFRSAAELAAFLRQQRNDLEPVACALEPIIGQVTAALQAQPGCLLARMSGSGATSFGLFAEQQSAEDAARALKRHAPGWWIRKTGLCKGSPQETRATT